jgi:hypothetical protein
MGGVINWKKEAYVLTSSNIRKIRGEGPVWAGLKPIPRMGIGEERYFENPILAVV